MRRKRKCCQRQPAAGGVSVFAGYFFIIQERASCKDKLPGRTAGALAFRCGGCRTPGSQAKSAPERKMVREQTAAGGVLRHSGGRRSHKI